MAPRPLVLSNYLHRFWIYQTERFPIFQHGPLIAAFSLSAVSFSMLLRAEMAWPDLGPLLVAFASAFCFFWQLRVADEFKDLAEDTRYRPYRPVPRGLVSLPELGFLAGMSALAQLGLAIWLEPRLTLLLVLVWAYLVLMSLEFFVPKWLKVHPITYLSTHMLIVPLIDFYTTATDWLVAGAAGPHTGLVWFLVLSFCNGIVIELGRKIRAPRDEELGVETYTVLWGRPKAIAAWLGALLATAIFAGLAAAEIGLALPVGLLLTILWIGAGVIGLRFLDQPTTSRARLIEVMSGLWTILMYLSVGTLPLLIATIF